MPGTTIKETYDELVTKGVIVPQPDVPPPAVPMDYAWARVRKMFLFPEMIILENECLPVRPGNSLIFSGVGPDPKARVVHDVDLR